MVQKSHLWGVIWVPSNRPQIGHLSEKNDNLAVQYEDVHDLCKPSISSHFKASYDGSYETPQMFVFYN